MGEIDHQDIDAGDVRLRVAVSGPEDGPVVLLLHGFPECRYSWRHQLAALGAAGYRAVAPDQRGYGTLDAPADVEAYAMPHLVGDAIGVLDALGAERAVVVGHDWGAPVAWSTALWRPDRVRGVVALSVPHEPRSRRRPTQALAETFGPDHYMLYFQEPGPADAELAADPRNALRRLFAATSGAGQPTPPNAAAGFVAGLGAPGELPSWLTEEDLDVYVDVFAGGFTGALSWYRNLDRNWELAAPWKGATVTPPALYLAGEHDLVVAGRTSEQLEARLRRSVADLRGVTLLPGCGHWTQQERPAEVNAALFGFLEGLPS
jgi:pimeloyl-ACP methyl ester carboxylesterase